MIALVFFAGLLTGVSSAETPRLVIPRTDLPPTLDDFRGMKPTPEQAKRLAKVEGFTQRFPVDGDPATQSTEVYLAYDESNLYAVFVCFDTEPDLVRANMAPRESVFDDDIVNVMIDTDNDQQRGYVFLSTALGVQWDGQFSESNGFDQAFDAVWKSDGRRTDQGFLVRMEIPFDSVRFPDSNEQTWRVMFNRDIARLGENTYWPPYSLAIEGRLNQAAVMTGIEDISPGRNMQFVPFVFARDFRVLDPASPTSFSEDQDFEAGLDAKFVIDDSLVLDVTVNPDFSQVESDEPQVTVNQRFEVQFAERRPLFLENADIFDTPTNLVFTRRIVDPGFGLKLTGKRGRWGIGTLLIDDEAPGNAPQNVGTALEGEDAQIGIVRITRDVGDQSRVGVLLTDRELGDGSNRVGGIDGRIKLHENWVANFQVASAGTRSSDGSSEMDGSSYNLVIDRSGKHLNTHTHLIYTSPGFRTQLGFLGRRQRPDARNIHNRVEYTFRPTDKKLNAWSTALFVGQIADTADDLRLEWEVRPSLSWFWDGDTELSTSYTLLDERLRPQDFPGLSMNRDYEQRRWSAEFETEAFDKVGFEVELTVGDAINFGPVSGADPELGDLVTGSVELLLRPLPRLRLETTYLYTRLDDPATDATIFTNEIARLRANWQFNKEISVRAIVQYDDTDANPVLSSLSSPRGLNLDVLGRYVVNPWTSLYVGFNSNESNARIVDLGSGPEIVPVGRDLSQDGRQLFVKFSYLFKP